VKVQTRPDKSGRKIAAMSSSIEIDIKEINNAINGFTVWVYIQGFPGNEGIFVKAEYRADIALSME
jgi:hypothetical protein